MKKIIAILGLLIIVLVSAGNGTYAKVDTKTLPKTQIEKLTQDSFTDCLNIEVKKGTEAVKLSKEDAIDKVKKIISPGYANEASGITAELSKFTDKVIAKLPDSNTVPQNITAWIVTLHDVNVCTHGGVHCSSYSSVKTDLNIIIDANTGEEIESFAYKK